MATESSNRLSFFDDDDLKILFKFCPPEKIHQKDLDIPPTLKSILFRPGPSPTVMQSGVYALHNMTLAYYKVNSHLRLTSMVRTKVISSLKLFWSSLKLE